MNFKKINKIFSLARKIKYFSKFTILASPLFNFFLWFYSKKVPNHLHSPRNFIVPDNINSTVFLAKLKTSYLFKYFNLKIKTLFLSKLFLKKNKNSVFNFLKKKTFYFKKTLKPKYNLKYFYAKISFYKSGNFNNFIAATSFSRALKRSFLLGKYKKKKLRNIKRRQLIFKHNLKKKKKYITKIKKSYISSLLRLINLFYFQKCRPTPINSTISHTFSFRKETEALKGRIFNQDSSYNNFKKIWFYKKENISGFKAYYFSLPFHDIKHLNYSFKHTLEPKLKTTNEEL